MLSTRRAKPPGLRPFAYSSILSLVLVGLVACVQPGLEDTAGEEAYVTAETRADALSLVPADAAAAIVVHDLEALDADYQLFVEALGDSGYMAFSPLEMLRSELGGGAGLRTDGSVMLVFPDAASFVEHDHSQILAFVAVDDYRAFVGEGAAEPDAGSASDPAASLDTIAALSQHWYVRPVEGYAVMSPDAERLAGFVPADGHGTSIHSVVAAMGDSVTNATDVTCIINLRTLGPVLAPEVAEDARNLAAGLAWSHLAESDIETLTSLHSLVAESVLRDAESLTIGADIGAEGFDALVSMNLAADSQLGRMVALGGAAAPLLDMLPAGPMSSAMGVDLSGFDRQALADWLLSGLPDNGELAELIASTLRLGVGADNIVAAAYRSEGDRPDTGLMRVQVESATDVAPILVGLSSFLQGTELQLPPITTEEDTVVTGSAIYDVRWESAGEELAGARVERFEIEPQVPDAYLELAETTLGDQAWVPESRGGLVATRDDVAVIAGRSAELLAAQLLGSERSSAPLSDDAGVQSLRQRAFLSAPFAELYISKTHHDSADDTAWQPFAIFGFLAPHEVAGQFTVPVESFR